MLHYKTIDTGTLELLKDILSIPEFSELRLAGLEDICAMKLAAITGRGTRKDFIDIYFLLRAFTLEEMFSFYTHKYADGSPFMVIKSLTYFEDAENEPEPYMFESIDWNAIKTEISKQVARLI